MSGIPRPAAGQDPQVPLRTHVGSSPTDGVFAAEFTQAVTLVAAARGALDSGMLDALERWQPCTADELAVRTHLTPHSVKLTVAALSAGGIAVVRGDGCWLLRGSCDELQSMLGNEIGIRRFIETGRGSCVDDPDGDATFAERRAFFGRVEEAIAAQIAPALLSTDLGALELGDKTAPWSRALLGLDPTASAVAVERVEVMRLLKQGLSGASIDGRLIGARLANEPGDLRTVTPADRFDLIVASGLCELLTAAENARLFERLSQWLDSGGQLLICDTLGDGPNVDTQLALAALDRAARSPAEDLWTLSHYARWLEHAGLAAPQVLATHPAGISVLLSTHFDTEGQLGK